MLNLNSINRLITSASTDVNRAIRNIDMLNLNNIEEILPKFYSDQLADDMNLLTHAVELLSDTLSDDSIEYTDEERKFIYEHLQIAARLINLYNQAWVQLVS
jgi:hypothetical protein